MPHTFLCVGDTTENKTNNSPAPIAVTFHEIISKAQSPLLLEIGGIS